uniref:uL14 family ribosomal protein n=1 Tax=Bacillus altitudinis TaxID=293387 RepID=UPI001643F2DB
MIEEESGLKVGEKCGGGEVVRIKVLGGCGGKRGKMGDVIVCRVKEATGGGVVKKGEVVNAAMVRSKRGG